MNAVLAFSIQDFPALNASLNGLAGLLLVSGLIAIKGGARKAHGILMIAALIASAAFLASYLTYHYLKEGLVTRFPGEYPAARKIYLAILISHTILAVINLPMVIVTAVLAARRRFESHRRVARWTYPVWLYVSATGVLVYFMLYQWFPPSASAAGPGGGDGGAPLKAGPLVFHPAVFEYHAEPGEKEFTARFTVRNAGNDPVNIAKIDSSCTCLKAEADTKELAPGESTRIVAEFDIGKAAGESEKLLFVHTDAPGAELNRLTVRVEVPEIYSIEPRMMEWIMGEDPETREIVFKVLRDRPIRVLDAVSSRENMKCELRTIEEGREYHLALTPESTEDILLGMVRISTDCELEHLQNPMAFFAVKRAEAPE